MICNNMIYRQTAKGPSGTDMGDKTPERINNEFNDMVVRYLGQDAADDQRPWRDYLRNLPVGGVNIVMDPGDLEPVHYPEQTPEQQREFPKFILEAVQAAAERRRLAGDQSEND